MIRRLLPARFTVAAACLALVATALFAQNAPTTQSAPATSQPAGEKVVTPEGLTIIKVAPGDDSGAAKQGDLVFVHYEGWLTNGTRFDGSRDHAEYAENGIDFPLGAGKVIKGWDLGVEGMKIGEKRTLLIPFQLAYGDRAVGSVIPPKSDLKFDIQLVGIIRRPVDAAPPPPPAE